MFRSFRSLCFLMVTFVCALTVGVPNARAQLAIQQSTTSRKMVFVMFATGTNTPTAGLTVTVSLSKNGGAFAAATGTEGEISNGAYSLTPSSADTGTLGSLVLRATATGADPCFKEFNVVFNSPDSAASDTAGTTTLLSRIPGTVQPQSGDSYGRLGAPAGASIAADIAGIPGLTWGVPTRVLTAFAFTPNVGNVTGTLPNVTVGAYASGQDPATLLMATTVNGRTFRQLCEILGISPAGSITSITRTSSSPWQQTIIYSDGACTATFVSTYSSSAFTTQTGRTAVSFTGL